MRRLKNCRVYGCLLVAVAFLIGTEQRIHAQRDERATVRVDGRAVFRVGPLETEGADDRRQRIEQRLSRLLEQTSGIGSLRVQHSTVNADEYSIVVSGVPVTRVTRIDAEDNFTSVENLAAIWSQTLEAALAQAELRRLSTGGRFGSEVRGSIVSSFARMLDSVLRLIPRTLAALLMLVIFWLLASLVRWTMRFIVDRFVEDLTFANLVKQVSYFAVWMIGILLAADALGFDADKVVTGLGLTGLVLGFALKDILSNFVSGILILALRSFRLGDQIVVGHTEGNVERIELRATQIRTYDGRMVIVPNAELLTSRIVNNTAAPVRRGSVEIGLSYATDLNHAREAVLAAMQAMSGVLSDPEPSVRIRELTADAIVMEGRFWTDSRRSDFLATQSAVAEGIVKRFQRDRLPLPEPATRLLVPAELTKWRTILRGSDGENSPGSA